MSFLPQEHTDRMLGSRILLMPPSLTLIFRHKLEMVCGDVLLTFFDWTHCVAMPNIMSPTRFTSAEIIQHTDDVKVKAKAHDDN